MASKLSLTFTVLYLFYTLFVIDCSFIKPNNVPRVGRSNEGAGPYDTDSAGYVIKVNKNIPRMGRRNYDSENHYDIPKIYSLPMETYGQYRDDWQQKYNQEQLNQYGYQLENTEK